MHLKDNETDTQQVNITFLRKNKRTTMYPPPISTHTFLCYGMGYDIVHG